MEILVSEILGSWTNGYQVILRECHNITAITDTKRL